MVAKEAATSREVKELIVNSPGVDAEKEWEASYNGDAGYALFFFNLAPFHFDLTSEQTNKQNIAAL